MKTKKLLIYGITTGLLSGLAGIIYQYIYQEMFYVDYSSVVNAGAILGSSLIGTVMMALGYFVLFKLKKEKLIWIINLVYILLAFASILPAMAVTLPLDVEFPELFPGLVVPMHFFVPMIFFGFSPLFMKQGDNA